MPNEIVIGKITESRGVTGAGTVETVFDVEYRVGEHGPFHLRLRPAEFNATRIKEETEKTAATINAVSS